MGPTRSCAIALGFICRQTAAPDGAGKTAVHKTNVGRGQDQVGVAHAAVIPLRAFDVSTGYVVAGGVMSVHLDVLDLFTSAVPD